MPTEILVMLVAVVGMTMTNLGVVIVLVVRLDRRISGLDTKIDGVHRDLNAKIDGVHRDLNAKIEGVHHKLDARIHNVEREVVDLKVSVSRIEGYLEASTGFTKSADLASGAPSVE